MTAESGSFAERLERRRGELAAFQLQQAEAMRISAEQQREVDAVAQEQRQRARLEIQAAADRKAAAQATAVAAQLALRAQVSADGAEASALLRRMRVRPNVRSFIDDGTPKGYFDRDIKGWLLRFDSSLNELIGGRFDSTRGTYGEHYEVTFHTRSTHAYVLTRSGDVLEKNKSASSYLPDRHWLLGYDYAKVTPDYVPDCEVIEEPNQLSIISLIDKQGLHIPELNEQKVITLQSYILDLVLLHQGHLPQ